MAVICAYNRCSVVLGTIVMAFESILELVRAESKLINAASVNVMYPFNRVLLINLIGFRAVAVAGGGGGDDENVSSGSGCGCGDRGVDMLLLLSLVWLWLLTLLPLWLLSVVSFGIVLSS